MASFVQVSVVVLVLAAFSHAMVPRSRRAIEDMLPMTRPSNTTEVIICNVETPCGWTVYELFTKRVDYFIRNYYCECGENKQCLFYEDDISIGAFVQRCQTPPPPTNTTETPSES